MLMEMIFICRPVEPTNAICLEAEVTSHCDTGQHGISHVLQLTNRRD